MLSINLLNTNKINMIKKHISALLTATTIASILTGCTIASPSSATSTSASQTEGNTPAPVNYSYGINDDGYYNGPDIETFVTLPSDYMNYTVTNDEIAPSEDDWNTMLGQLTQQAGTKTTIEKTAEANDWVTIDFTGTVDGKEFDGGSAVDTTLQIGMGSYLPDFENAIEGHKAGDTFEATVTFPEGYGATNDSDGNEIQLDGKTAVFSITLKSVDEYTLTDEDIKEYYASDDSENTIDSLDALRAAWEEQTKNNNMQNKIMEKLTAETKIASTPEEIIDAYVTVELDMLRYNAEYTGMTQDEIVQMSGYENVNEFEQEIRSSAANLVKSTLILLAVAKDNGITYNASECKDLFGQEEATLIETYGQNYVKQSALVIKAARAVLDAATIE